MVEDDLKGDFFMQKNSKKRYYIAYGSNLNTVQMRWRCPNAIVMGTAELKDWRLVFKGSKTGSYLTIEPAKGYTVPVAVWEVNESDEANLDRYEGYPTFYYKKELELEYKGISSGRKRKRKVFVYIMHEDRPYGVPSKHYLETCAFGYDVFRFDINVLREAYRYSKEVSGC